MNRRMTKLLEAVAADLRDGNAPLGDHFLIEHQVTSDEVFDLADAMAGAIDFLLAAVDMHTSSSSRRR